MTTDTVRALRPDLDEARIQRALDGDLSGPLNSDEVLAVVDRMRGRGDSYDRIGRLLDVSTDTVTAWHKREYPPRSIGGLSSHDVTIRAGVTYRQLDHWVRTERIPGVDRLVAVGSGVPRRFTETEAAYVELLARLLRIGLNFDVAANALRYQHEAGVDVTTLTELPLPDGAALLLHPRLAVSA